MTTKYGLFVPDVSTGDGQALAAMIHDRSGIVGRATGDSSRVELYYEGNLHGYDNVHTFADRVEVAAGRMSASYPTIARAIVPADALICVGTFDPERREVEVAYEAPLARWLGHTTRVPDAELTITRSVR